MMRRVAHTEAPLAGVRALFHDLEAWPTWMPDLKSLRIVESRAGKTRATIEQAALGRVWKQNVEIALEDRRVSVRALDGLSRWKALWGFQSPPSGGGTTLSLELEATSSPLGAAGQKMFLRLNHRRFDTTLAAVSAHAARLTVREVPGEEGRPEFAVYETDDGLEVWYRGRRYKAVPIETAS